MFGKRKIKLVTIVATVILAVAIMAVVPVTKAEAITETTGTPSQTLLSTPLPTCLIHWNQSSYTVTNGSTFQVKILITNVNYLVSGQWDVFYNRSILNVVGRPTAGSINDVYDRTYQGNPVEGCGWVPVDINYAGINIGYGTATTNSGCLRFIAFCTWAQSDPEECAGGGGTGPVGDGYLTTITFKGVSPGTCDIALGANQGAGTLRFKTQMNQIVDWAVYQDYSYPGSDVLVWGPNASVTVTGSDGPTPTPTVSPTVSPTMSPTPTATPSPTPTTRVYNFVGVSRATNDHFAYYCDEDDNLPPPALDEMKEATDTQYSQIKSSNNLRWACPSPGKGDYPFMKFDMNIKENPVHVSQIDLSFEGFAVKFPSGTFKIWVYNYNSSSWSQLGVSQEIKWLLDGTITRSITSKCNEYISEGGMLTWGVFVDETNVVMATDYVEAKVTAIGP